MRHKDLKNSKNSKYKIIAVDDEVGIIDSLSVLLKRSGYTLVGVTDPYEAIEKVKNEHFDLMLLDFMMSPIHGDTVVEEIRKFNKDLYIILLTGHTDLVPPLETIKRLEIQGYCEKENKFDQLMLLIESAFKSIEQVQIIQRINEELKESQDKLESAYLESIQVLRETVEAKDSYTKGHSDRVSAYSVLLGEKLGLSKEDIRTLQVGGWFHDIGKIGVSDEIITKPGKLTDDEFSEIKMHPEIGKHILSNATLFNNIIPIVLHHHERYDGKGYPSGLKGEKIPALARIVTIADAFDAMTSTRSYRPALEIETVKKEIEKNRGSQFDEKYADAFLEILNNEYDKILEIKEKFPSNK